MILIIKMWSAADCTMPCRHLQLLMCEIANNTWGSSVAQLETQVTPKQWGGGGYLRTRCWDGYGELVRRLNWARMGESNIVFKSYGNEDSRKAFARFDSHKKQWRWHLTSGGKRTNEHHNDGTGNSPACVTTAYFLYVTLSLYANKVHSLHY